MRGFVVATARAYGRHTALYARSASSIYAPLSRHFSEGSRAPQRHVVGSQDEMEALGARVALGRTSGDVVFLRGDLGCGKTCFARGFIRAMTRDAALHVTSPTYLLVNTYDGVQERSARETNDSPVIHHVDLYRLDSVNEVDATAIGLTDAFATGISLVEWPQRLLEGSVPSERLEVHISYDDDHASMRHIEFLPIGDRWGSFEIE